MPPPSANLTTGTVAGAGFGSAADFARFSNSANNPVSSVSLANAQAAKNSNTNPQTSPAPTVITNASLGPKIADNTTKLAAASSAGISTGPNGLQYANGKLVNRGGYQGTGQYGNFDGVTYLPPDAQNPYGSAVATKPAADSTSTDPTKPTETPDGKPTTTTNTDGSATTTYSTGTGDPTVDKYIQQLEAIKANADAATTSQIENIHQQFAGLITAQEEVNRQKSASITQSLLSSGASRYAPLSSAGVVSTEVTAGIQAIGDLQIKEQSAVTAAQQAQNDQDYKLVDRLLTQADEIRKEKQDAISKVNDALIKANQTVADNKVQQQKDDAVAKLFASGVTDPAQILSQLKKLGQTDITAKDIGDAIKNLSLSAGVDTTQMTGYLKDYWNTVNNNLPLPPSIASLPADQQPYAFVKYLHNLNSTASGGAPKKVAPYVTLSPSQKQQGLGAGFTSDKLDQIVAGAAQYGWPEVIKTESPYLTPAQLTYLNSVASGHIERANASSTSTGSATDFSGVQ